MFCDEYGAGVYYRTRSAFAKASAGQAAPAQEQGARLTAMHRRPFDFRVTHKRKEAGNGFCNRRMQRESRSRFATSTGRECTIVLDRPGTGARREIDRDAPPPFRFFTTNGTIIKNPAEPRKRNGGIAVSAAHQARYAESTLSKASTSLFCSPRFAISQVRLMPSCCLRMTFSATSLLSMRYIFFGTDQSCWV